MPRIALARASSLLGLTLVLGAGGCWSAVPAKPVADAPTAPAAEVAAPPEVDRSTPFETTASGLKYRVLRVGEGKKPTASDSVLAHYRGWLDDGTEFDSSYKGGEPIEFPLNGVIAGWTEGLQLIGEGGMIELEIPSELGYGAQGAPGAIPPNSTLHFDVELIEVR